MPLGFVAGFLNHDHADPESFTAAPVTLVAPGADRWTPVEVSTSFLRRIAAPTKVVVLENCGHLPVEEPGIGRLRAEVLATVSEVAPAR